MVILFSLLFVIVKIFTKTKTLVSKEIPVFYPTLKYDVTLWNSRIKAGHFFQISFHLNSPYLTDKETKALQLIPKVTQACWQTWGPSLFLLYSRPWARATALRAGDQKACFGTLEPITQWHSNPRGLNTRQVHRSTHTCVRKPIEGLPLTEQKDSLWINSTWDH